MPSKNKTKKSEIYWAIPYNMCPSPKEKKNPGMGGGVEGLHYGRNVREVAIQEMIQRQKIRVVVVVVVVVV